MNDNNSDFGAFLAGFVIGGLVGAATALILAPQSGEQTRSQISNKSQEWRETGEQRVQQYREISNEKMHDYQSRASNLIHRDQDAEAAGEDQARIVLDDGSDQTESVVEKAKPENGASPDAS